MNFYYTAKCTEDSGCSGSTDNCDTAAGVCKCGHNGACSGNKPSCNDGKCEGMYTWLDTWLNQNSLVFVSKLFHRICIWFYSNFYYTAKCTEDSGCSGSTDNCDTATGVCKCGPNDACSGNTPMCDGGDCKGMFKWLDAWFNQDNFNV